jgi:putative ABC transport system permease protein
VSALGAVLRIARRDARRARGRSLLVVAMIALPVLGVTAVDVVARTYELSPEQRAPREFGRADAYFQDTGWSGSSSPVAVTAPRQTRARRGRSSTWPHCCRRAVAA